MRVYFISGLGADERMFRHIQLPGEFVPVYLPWLIPKPGEPLTDYAMRMAESIDTSEKFIVAGLSMGGMIATEIGLRFPQATVILISSVCTYAELPLLYRIAGKTGIYRLIPVRSLKHASYIKRLFSAETGEHKKMLRQMIANCDPALIKWSMSAILHWKNTKIPPRIFHIHGDRDLILPLKYTHADTVVNGAGHLMVLDRYEDVNRWLGTVLLQSELRA